MEELWIWKDVFVNFEHCWTKYNKNNKLRKDTESTKMANKELCNENFGENVGPGKSTTDQQESTIYFNKSNDIVEPVKNMKNNVSIKNRLSKSPFTEVTG